MRKLLLLLFVGVICSCENPTLLLLAVFAGQQLLAQDPDTQFKIFGHLTATAEEVDGEYASNFSLGEQDLFVLSQITPRISLLGETVVGPPRDLDFRAGYACTYACGYVALCHGRCRFQIHIASMLHLH